MNIDDLKYCPGTLAEGFNTYSPICLRAVFNGKKVHHILPYAYQKDDAESEQFLENRKRISISGVQEKLSMLLDKNKLRLTNPGEQGTYILKPIPRDLKNVGQVPANEHLTMQIAKQVYNINTAENAMIFFNNGIPAYITKRFDVKDDNMKWGKEDFASLAGKTKDNAGPDFKYKYSYEEVGKLIQEFVPAWRVEIEKYFTLVLFNYVFSNGDAHLKNFSLLETTKGDYILSPAYDLVNTSLHVHDTGFALEQGLFSDDFRRGSYKKNAYPAKADFVEFAKRIGVMENRVEKIILPFLEKQPMAETLIDHSFLNDASKKTYLLSYYRKINLLNG